MAARPTFHLPSDSRALTVVSIRVEHTETPVRISYLVQRYSVFGETFRLRVRMSIDACNLRGHPPRVARPMPQCEHAGT